jgi:KaiC/GvpD/RAD55 family RecA-like ATPase
LSKSSVLAEPVLVGREKELGELQSYLNSAVQGKGKTVFVSGEAGSGKTRLTREFLNLAIKHGVAVMAGWCLSDAQVPYFPFMEAFNNYYASRREEETSSSLQSETNLSLRAPVQIGIESGDQEITSWLVGPKQTEKLGAAGALSPEAWKDQVFATVSRTLHAVAAKEPVILFFEDLHWADSASLALLHYLARVISNSEKVLVLATYRTEALTADAEGRPHPLAETLRLMRREELIAEIQLPNLSQTNVKTIAENMMGGNLQPELTEKLATESRGNPLFLVESLRMLHEHKSLVKENNQWRLAVDELGIPSKIKDIILRRLARLKYAQRRILDAASVVGEEFDVELLSAVLGQDSLEVLETLNLISRSTSLVQAEESGFRFDHARSRETLYEELSSPLKGGYHNRIAEKLESIKTQTLPLTNLAYHYKMAGNTEKAVRYSLAAGQDALAKWSNNEAIKHFTYVLQTVEEKPEHAKERETALEGLGNAYYTSSMYMDAMKTFEKLIDSTENNAARLRALTGARRSTINLGDMPHLSQLTKKSELYAAGDRLETARVSNAKAILLSGDDLPAALECARAALQVFEEEYSLSNAAWTLMSAGNYDCDLGRPEEGITESLRSVALLEELGDIGRRQFALIAAGTSFCTSILVSEALKTYAKVVEADEKMRIGDYMNCSLATVLSATSLELEGDFVGALQYALKAFEFSKKTDSEVAKGLAYASLTRIYAELGDMKHAEEFFARLAAIPPEILNHMYTGWGLAIILAKAIFYSSEGKWAESNQQFQEFLQQQKTHPAKSFRVLYLQSYSWALQKQGCHAEAKALLEESQRIRQEAQARFEHANVQFHVMIRRKVEVGETFEMHIDLINVGRRPASVFKIDGLLPSDVFVVEALPSWTSTQNGSLFMNNKNVAPFEVTTVKFKLRISQAGTFNLSPEAVYTDDQGNTKTFKVQAITITAKPAKPTFELLPGRIATGTLELDKLLLGGIPKKYAVALVAPSSDERQFLIRRFIEAGPRNGETAIYMTCEASGAAELAQEFQTNLYVGVCNIQADSVLPNLPNLFKLKGTENLTEIDIALTKLFRAINLPQNQPRRVCIDLISDVLLQHHALTTRKWLSNLLTNLKSKGFTTLAVIDSAMHPPDEAQAILSLFDGEIRITEKGSEKGRRRILEIARLYNQRYLENELVLIKEQPQ